MKGRYPKAEAALPVVLLSRLTGSSVQGYWVGHNTFFFVREEWDDAEGEASFVPMIVDAATGTVKPLLAPENIAECLESAGLAIDEKELKRARFSMPDEGHLAVEWKDEIRLINLVGLSVSDAIKVAATPALYSPDGRMAVVLEGDDLVLRHLASSKSVALTDDGQPLHAYGREPENALAPITHRAQAHPIGIWSDDSRWFLTHCIDERDLPELSMVQNAPPGGKKPILHKFKLSAPGEPLPRVTIVALHVASGRRIESSAFAMYAFSPVGWHGAWFVDERRFCYLKADRYHRCYELIAVDLESGAERLLVREEAEEGYLDIHPLMLRQPNVHTLPSTDEVVWYSERDGWGHLYLYDVGAVTPKAQITKGEWQVRDIVHVDEPARRIFFTAGRNGRNADGGMRRLCAANLDGSGFVELLGGDDDIAVLPAASVPVGQDRRCYPSLASRGVSDDGRYVVARRTSLGRPSSTVIFDLVARTEIIIATTDKALLPIVLPRLVETLADDGRTLLHGALFLPSDFDENGCYPLIDYIYPGPHVTWLPRAFGSHVAAQAQALAELGTVVLVLDSRGVPFRSRAFHQSGRGSLAEPQLADHAVSIQQLIERHSFLDGSRVGMIGSSGGGFATAHALFEYSHIFHAGISIVGNHNVWNYRSIWVDKYVAPWDPEIGSDVHLSGSFVQGLRGKLMLISADMDENVHVGQTLQLADALIGANKDFDLLIIPNEGHSLQLTSAYAQRRIWDFFSRHLIGKEPPHEYPLAYEPRQIAATAETIQRDSEW